VTSSYSSITTASTSLPLLSPSILEDQDHSSDKECNMNDKDVRMVENPFDGNDIDNQFKLLEDEEEKNNNDDENEVYNSDDEDNGDGDDEEYNNNDDEEEDEKNNNDEEDEEESNDAEYTNFGRL
jgi:hypothetical protein